MTWLNEYFKWLLEASWFQWIISILIALYPFFMASQVLPVLMTENVEGISILKWLILLGIQGALMFNGIKTKDKALFWSMLLSVPQSIAVIITVIMRS